jgi:hypothetical protein
MFVIENARTLYLRDFRGSENASPTGEPVGSILRLVMYQECGGLRELSGEWSRKCQALVRQWSFDDLKWGLWEGGRIAMAREAGSIAALSCRMTGEKVEAASLRI